MTYFFALFLGATLATLPWLIVAAAIGTAVSLGMTFVLPEHRDRQLRRALRSLRARLRLLLDTVATGLGGDHLDQRYHRRLVGRMDRVSESTLMIDGQLGVDGAPDGLAPAMPDSLRLGLFDVELAAGNLVRWWWRAGSSSDSDGQVSAFTRAKLAEAVRGLDAALGHDRSVEGLSRAEALADGVHAEPATPAPYRLVALALGGLARAIERTRTSAGLDAGPAPPSPEIPAESAEPAGPEASEATSGQPAGSWLQRLSPSTRQAIQVTIAVSLAIVAGELLSPARWYWAVIAAYVIYTGTTTRGETLIRGWQRILGTLVGVGVGAVIACLVGGNVTASFCLIFVSLFVGFYLRQLSYAFMVGGITTMLALLYGLLGEFSIGLLLTRIEATAIGAVIGMVVALAVLPTSTRATGRGRLRSYLAALADLVEQAGQRLAGASGDDLTVRARRLDQLLADVRASAKPFTESIFDTSRRCGVQRGLAVLGGCAYYARLLARVSEPAPDQATRTAFRRLADHVSADVVALAGMFDGDQPHALVTANDLIETLGAAVDPGRGRLIAAARSLQRIDLAVVRLSHDLSGTWRVVRQGAHESA